MENQKIKYYFKNLYKANLKMCMQKILGLRVL